MCGRLRVEATWVAGRVVAWGGALVCGEWREERNGGEGAGIGVRGARGSYNLSQPKRTSSATPANSDCFVAKLPLPALREAGAGKGQRKLSEALNRGALYSRKFTIRTATGDVNVPQGTMSLWAS